MRKTALAVTLSAAALAGCDGPSPAGAGVDASEVHASRVHEQIDRITELAAARKKGMTEQTPLLPLFFQAVESTVNPIGPEHMGNIQAECAIADDEANRAQYLEDFKAAGIELASVPKQGDIASLIVHGTQNENAASCLGRSLMQASRPVVGWIGPLSFSEGFNYEGMQQQARTIYATTRASEIVASAILPEVRGHAGYSTDELVRIMRGLFVDNAIALRTSAIPEMQRILSLPGNAFSLDMAGSTAPVHFVVPSEGVDIEADAMGSHLTKHGVQQFGRGYLGGTLYAVETVRTNTAETRTTSAAGAATETTTAQGANAGAKTQ